jgi:hypothetical protein
MKLIGVSGFCIRFNFTRQNGGLFFISADFGTVRYWSCEIMEKRRMLTGRRKINELVVRTVTNEFGNGNNNKR